jgi:hypothetical protein
MITAKDLDAIEKIKAYIAEQGYTDISVSLIGTERACAPVCISFCQASSATSDELDRLLGKPQEAKK